MDGIETTIDFWIHDVLILASSSENEELNEYLNSKNSEDILNIKLDLSTFKYNEEKYDLDI